MDLAFSVSYVFLGALLGIESFIVHSILQRSVRVRAAFKKRHLAAPASCITRIPNFRGTLFVPPADASKTSVVTADLEGHSTALLFADKENLSNPTMDDVYLLLRNTHQGRSLYVFLGANGDDASSELGVLPHVLQRFNFKSLTLVFDGDYAIAEKFGINEYPVIVLATADGEIERVWTARGRRCHRIKPGIATSGLTET